MRAGELPGWLWRSGHIVPRIARFGGVGVLASAVYAMVTALLVTRLQVQPVPAAIAGYCVSVPVSFLGHRGFSFRSQGHWTGEALRFAVTQAINIAVTAAAMDAAVRWLHVSWAWGMVGAVVLVPLANFLAMNFWVFRTGTADGGSRA